MALSYIFHNLYIYHILSGFIYIFIPKKFMSAFIVVFTTLLVACCSIGVYFLDIVRFGSRFLVFFLWNSVVFFPQFFVVFFHRRMMSIVANGNLVQQL